VDPVGSKLNRVQKESNPEAVPAGQPQTVSEEGQGGEATDRKATLLPSQTAALAVPPRTESQPLTNHPAAPKSVEEKTGSGPAFDRVSAEKTAAERAAQEAALLEILRSSEALVIPLVPGESGRAGPENASALGWPSGAVVSLLALGVVVWQQRRSTKRTADESDRGTD
jgi:hypothetical protein